MGKAMNTPEQRTGELPIELAIGIRDVPACRIIAGKERDMINGTDQFLTGPAGHVRMMMPMTKGNSRTGRRRGWVILAPDGESSAANKTGSKAM
jgi:hypothetical protein